MEKRKVIIVTDGDKCAKRAVEVAAKNVGARCITASWGNPTPRDGKEILSMVLETPYDPVVVMVDDRGMGGVGQGETVLDYLGHRPELDIIGVVAVASHDPAAEGIPVTVSVTKDNQVVDGPVDKDGIAEPSGHKYLEGDTVDIISGLNIPVVIGTGDTGKMQGKDSFKKGAEITTRAFREILERSGL